MNEQKTVEWILQEGFAQLKTAHETLSNPELKSRENSLVLTKLEEALMWLDKDRANKGYSASDPKLG